MAAQLNGPGDKLGRVRLVNRLWNSAEQSTMRTLATFYAISVTVTQCWVVNTFGLPRLTFGCLLTSPGFYVLWRMRKESIGASQAVYLAVTGIITASAIGFFVFKAYSLGLDRTTKFVREYHGFRRTIANQPEYGSVDISCTERKGGRVYLEGTVATKELHDRLIESLKTTVKSNASGCYDGVSYPGKSNPSSN